MESKGFEKCYAESTFFAKSTPFPNSIEHFGPRLQPHKTSKVELENDLR